MDDQQNNNQPSPPNSPVVPPANITDATPPPVPGPTTPSQQPSNKSPRYSEYPYLYKNFGRFWLIVIIGGPITLFLIARDHAIMLTIGLIVLSIQYYVFFIIPCVWYIRRHGRYLFVPAFVYGTTKYAIFYRPLGDSPHGWGAQRISPGKSFIIATLCMLGFLVFCFAPLAFVLGAIFE